MRRGLPPHDPLHARQQHDGRRERRQREAEMLDQAGAVLEGNARGAARRLDLEHARDVTPDRKRSAVARGRPEGRVRESSGPPAGWAVYRDPPRLLSGRFWKRGSPAGDVNPEGADHARGQKSVSRIEKPELADILVRGDDDGDAESLDPRRDLTGGERLERPAEEGEAVALLDQLRDRARLGGARIDEAGHGRRMGERTVDDPTLGLERRQRRDVAVGPPPLGAIVEGHAGAKEQHAAGRGLADRLPEGVELLSAHQLAVGRPPVTRRPERERGLWGARGSHQRNLR